EPRRLERLVVAPRVAARQYADQSGELADRHCGDQLPDLAKDRRCHVYPSGAGRGNRTRAPQPYPAPGRRPGREARRRVTTPITFASGGPGTITPAVGTSRHFH